MTLAPIKPVVSLDVLEQIDIRVGTILAVADVPNSEKLVQLRVSFGDHERTIVAGIKTERANPQEIEGKQALFVVNLEPRKMRGVLSEGMLFDIGYADGVRPVLALPENPVPDGTGQARIFVSAPKAWHISKTRKPRGRGAAAVLPVRRESPGGKSSCK